MTCTVSWGVYTALFLQWYFLEEMVQKKKKTLRIEIDVLYTCFQFLLATR